MCDTYENMATISLTGSNQSQRKETPADQPDSEMVCVYGALNRELRVKGEFFRGGQTGADS